MTKIRLVAFDLFGTVFNMSGVPKQEIRDYIAHVRKPEWSPLTLPKSWWSLQPFKDSVAGIESIFDDFTVATLSNAPFGFTCSLLQASRLSFMLITDIAQEKCYKPDPRAYLALCEQMEIEPEECLMVTGNAGSPDIEGARAVGMQAQMIRQPGTPQTIIELAEMLRANQ